MAWQQYSSDTETTLVVGKIREGDPPFFVLALCMAFINKPVNTIALTNVTLVVLAIVLVRDLLLQLEELRDEMIALGSCRQGNWRCWLRILVMGMDMLVKSSNWMRYNCYSTG